MERSREVYTPDQAAAYLQVNRETIYRYIREGKLVASKLGRTYRITRPNLERLLETTQTRAELPLRRYTSEQVEQFLKDDELSDEAREVIATFEDAIQPRPAPTR